MEITMNQIRKQFGEFFENYRKSPRESIRVKTKIYQESVTRKFEKETGLKAPKGFIMAWLLDRFMNNPMLEETRYSPEKIDLMAAIVSNVELDFDDPEYDYTETKNAILSSNIKIANSRMTKRRKFKNEFIKKVKGKMLYASWNDNTQTIDCKNEDILKIESNVLSAAQERMPDEYEKFMVEYSEL